MHAGEESSAERLLREHFEQLTLSFLQPLETFTSMGSLSLRAPPTAAEAGSGLMMHDWSYEGQSRFLRELEKLEPPPLPRSLVPERAALLRLYTSFFRTPHFALWWERRRRRADAAL